MSQTKKKENVSNKFYVREWLNKEGHHSVAFILASIDVDESRWGGRYSDSSIIISDCNRQIELTFDTNCEESFENSLYKLNILIKTLKEFKCVLEKEGKITLSENKAKKEAQKKEGKPIDNLEKFIETSRTAHTIKQSSIDECNNKLDKLLELNNKEFKGTRRNDN